MFTSYSSPPSHKKKRLCEEQKKKSCTIFFSPTILFFFSSKPQDRVESLKEKKAASEREKFSKSPKLRKTLKFSFSSQLTWQRVWFWWAPKHNWYSHSRSFLEWIDSLRLAEKEEINVEYKGRLSIKCNSLRFNTF